MRSNYESDILNAGILAHQGGWDEILLVAIPIIIIAALVLLATRRLSKLYNKRNISSDSDPSNPDSSNPDSRDPDPNNLSTYTEA